MNGSLSCYLPQLICSMVSVSTGVSLKEITVPYFYNQELTQISMELD